MNIGDIVVSNCKQYAWPKKPAVQGSDIPIIPIGTLGMIIDHDGELRDGTIVYVVLLCDGSGMVMRFCADQLELANET